MIIWGHNRFDKRPIGFKMYRVPHSSCLACGHKLDTATDPSGAMPKKGDVSICLYCGHLMVFKSNGKLRNPTGDEIVELAGRPDILEAQRFRGDVMKQREKQCQGAGPPSTTSSRR